MRSSLSGVALAGWMLIVVAGGCASQGGHPGATPDRSKPEQSSEDNLSDPLTRLSRNKSAGLVIGRSPSGFITAQAIQGGKSFYGSSEPLYIVDDVPFHAASGGELVGLSPDDIDSIKLLTKPEDVAIYGVRGGNGVIVIKMKKAGRSEH